MQLVGDLWYFYTSFILSYLLVLNYIRCFWSYLTIEKFTMHQLQI